MALQFKPIPMKMLTVAALTKAAIWSKADAIFVVSIPCSKCGNHFLEELGDAVSNVNRGVNPLCIRCDPEAQ